MTYDYIIIGAGSAGCVLANRLSENPANSVLLLEAGGRDTHPYIHIPGAYAKLHRSSVDWGYETEPQQHILNRKIYLPRGKTLGGCSSTNAMAYVRGNKEDYNDWARLGNNGWSYEDVLPYFKKSEANEDIHNEYHSQQGELNVCFPEVRTPYSAAFIDACAKHGFERNEDYNGAKQAGAGLFQFTIKNGKRHSGVAAFLKPAMQRKNLKVITKAHTKKVLLEGGRATGVEVGNMPNQSSIYKAKKEVILAAGAFASPQLLMLSGIGDADELKQHGIACVQELPGVGKNLQDHLFVPISALSQQQEGQNHHIPLWNQLKDTFNYFARNKGILKIGPLEAVAFGSTNASPERVDYQFHFCAFHLGEGYETDFYDVNTFPHEDGYSILPTLLRPASRGVVSLRDNNPFSYPIIQPNFLEAEADRKVLINGCKKAIEVLHASDFNNYHKRLIAPPDHSSDDAIFLHIQKQLETVYHPVGTCKMGTDEMAVVDEQLRVKNIEGLRVIDASIMPTIVSGNTNAPVYMIAEKGADMILSA